MRYDKATTISRAFKNNTYKEDLAWDNLQGLVYYKTQLT